MSTQLNVRLSDSAIRALNNIMYRFNLNQRQAVEDALFSYLQTGHNFKVEYELDDLHYYRLLDLHADYNKRNYFDQGKDQGISLDVYFQIVILNAVTLSEAQEFIDNLYSHRNE